jgi:membrane protease YdiL (CAAX protease family)
MHFSQREAKAKAESFLDSLRVNRKGYTEVVVFDYEDWADRYLQRTIGIKQTDKFIKSHNVELFFWKVRFFKELKKEEYNLRISTKTGEILAFKHFLEDITPKSTVSKDSARKLAEEFLKQTFKTNFEAYDLHEEKIKRFDKRTDYIFSWEKKGVYIPWKKDEGGAKLLLGATVSGDEISAFYTTGLDIPEKFRRFIQKQLMLGEYLFSFYLIIFIIMLVSSFFILVKYRSYLIPKLCKKWYISWAIFLLIINILLIFNSFKSLLDAYPTSISLSSFIGIFFVRTITSSLLLYIAYIIPGIAGEALRSEVFKDRQNSSFVYFLRTTFYSRNVSRAILFGYILFFILLSLQSGIFDLGQKYLGVWKEWSRLVQSSSSYVPFFTAFAIAVSAAFMEEVFFRIFGISWIKKYFKNTVLAVLFTSLIWGLGHSSYAIFPVWFRVLEVGIIGVVLGFILIRYGIIPVLIAHYLLDAFWGTAPYILGRSNLYLFTGSLIILLIPLILSCLAFFANKEEKVKEIKMALNGIQKYNLGILTAFISDRKSRGLSASEISKELIEHNWDIELVSLAVAEVFGS